MSVFFFCFFFFFFFQKRPRKNCTVEGCSGYVQNMARHMRQCHSDLKYLRERKAGTRMKCGLENCTGCTTRLDLHLMRQHQLKKGTEDYEQALQLAYPFVTEAQQDVTTETAMGTLKEAIDDYW